MLVSHNACGVNACAQTACVNLLAASQKVNLLVVKLLAGQLLVFSRHLHSEFKERREVACEYFLVLHVSTLFYESKWGCDVDVD